MLAEEGQTVGQGEGPRRAGAASLRGGRRGDRAGDLVQAKAKTKAARQMVDAARSSVGE